MSLRFVDLFCGGGFGARGAVQAGATPVLGVDSWDVAVRTYGDNFPSADVVCSPIQDLSPRALAKRYEPDVLLTSPECTSHSVARGARPACELSRETAIGIVPWLRWMRPRWLIVENVRRMKKWSRHDELIETIESYDYRVSDLHLNAAEFGTPQSRKRMFLICSREGVEIASEDLLRAHGKGPKDAASIIDWSDRYRSAPLYKAGRAKSTIERAERAIEALGPGVPFLIVYYGSDGAGGWQQLDVPLRTVTTLDRFGLVTWKSREPFLRMLQPPELIRAMGAGTKHQLRFGSRREQIKLCGNGVCSPVMEVIFRKLARIDGIRAHRAA